MTSVAGNFGGAPPPPPMPGILSSGAPPPPPPPGMGVGQTYKEQREQAFQEQQMANLPSSLMTTAAKADKKPFSYTPVGLSAVDLKAPSALRKDKLEAIASGENVPTAAVVPGIPRAPTNVRIFNGITPPAYDPNAGRASPNAYSQSPSVGRRNSNARSETGSDKAGSAPIQSRSFRILQWMTGADEDPDIAASPPPSKAQPDEMKFSGYNRSDSIPSRAYKNLERMTSQDSEPGPVQPFRSENFRTAYTDETGSNARYGGNAIPSRSFRALQNMTDSGDTLHAAPPSPTLGRRSPNPALTQHHYGRDSPTSFAAPSHNDFKNTGPQYSTYPLPPPAQYVSSPGISASQPRFSSSVSLIPGGGDQRKPQDYMDQSGPYNSQPNAYSNQGHGGHNPQQSHAYSGNNYVPPSQQQAVNPRQYSGGNIPSRIFRHVQAMTGEDHSTGRSDF